MVRPNGCAARRRGHARLGDTDRGRPGSRGSGLRGYVVARTLGPAAFGDYAILGAVAGIPARLAIPV